MLNLHPPFRRAGPEDIDLVWALVGERGHARPAEAVVAEEAGRIVAVLDGRPDGETWHIDALAVANERAADLGPRVLAGADALAAEDGMTVVAIDPSALDPAIRAILETEGFRAGEAGWATRPVVPQG